MAKSVTLKFTPREIGRGEWGKEFYISTFRFPLGEAQKLEKRAKAMNLTMSSLVNQLVMVFNETVPGPKGPMKLERTAEPTIWGVEAKKALKKPVNKAKKVTKPVKAQKQEVRAAAPAAALLEKLKRLRQDEAA